MKRVLYLFAIVCSLMLTSCGDDAEVTTTVSSFKYDIDELYGIWETTDVYNSDNNEWEEITSNDNMYYFRVRFYSNGTFELDGSVYLEAGSYTADGSIIKTYVNSTLTGEYNVTTMSGGEMSATKAFGTQIVDYKFERIYHDSSN